VCTGCGMIGADAGQIGASGVILAR